jgi:hypothetical protein
MAREILRPDNADAALGRIAKDEPFFCAADVSGKDQG